MRNMQKIVGLHIGCKGEVYYIRHSNGAKFYFCDKCQLSTRKGAHIEFEHFSN